MKCNECNYTWIDPQYYPKCPQCGSNIVTIPSKPTNPKNTLIIWVLISLICGITGAIFGVLDPFDLAHRSGWLIMGFIGFIIGVFAPTIIHGIWYLLNCISMLKKRFRNINYEQ
ncbi:MAG: hypothetical protein ACFFA3_21505 [Promethearchaeota archaeon]